MTTFVVIMVAVNIIEKRSLVELGFGVGRSDLCVNYSLFRE